MWPWKKARRDIEDARQRASSAEWRAVEAELDNAAAGAQLQAAQQQAEESTELTKSLRKQIVLNGFT
ncbi:voltage-gated Ion Channel (VIC) superfamily, partial [Mycolicibacterium canariasense]